MFSQLLDKQRSTSSSNKSSGWLMEDKTDLSLGPSHLQLTTNLNKLSNSSTDHQTHEVINTCNKKRKYMSWYSACDSCNVELHLKDPLPADWEQCLDLESGRMYYMNRSTQKKSWSSPKNQRLDLELNMSPAPCLSPDEDRNMTQVNVDDHSKVAVLNDHSSYSNMVAIACARCHLLVMLSKSSPSCPNCKYVHSLPTLKNPIFKLSSPKPLETLSLLN